MGNFICDQPSWLAFIIIRYENQARRIQSNIAITINPLPTTSTPRVVDLITHQRPMLADANNHGTAMTPAKHNSVPAKFAFAAAANSPRIACAQAVVAPHVGHKRPVQR